MGAAEWHRAFKPPHCRRRWGERGNLKISIACRRPSYGTRAKRGHTGGKVRFPPVLHVHCVHHVHSTFPPAGEVHYAEPILCAASCRCDITALPLRFGTGLATPEQSEGGYGCVRKSTEEWHMAYWGLCALNFRSTWQRGGISQSKVSPRAPCALRFPENIAHSLRLAKHFTHSRYCAMYLIFPARYAIPNPSVQVRPCFPPPGQCGDRCMDHAGLEW